MPHQNSYFTFTGLFIKTFESTFHCFSALDSRTIGGYRIISNQLKKKSLNIHQMFIYFRLKIVSFSFINVMLLNRCPSFHLFANSTLVAFVVYFVLLQDILKQTCFCFYSPGGISYLLFLKLTHKTY